MAKDADDLSCSRMSDPKYSSKIFKLLWVQSLHIGRPQYTFRLLFQDKTGMYLHDFFPPERLYKYTVGSYYRKDKLIKDIPPMGKELRVVFNSTGENRIARVSEILTDDEYDLNHSFTGGKGTADYSIDNKRQFCLVFEDSKAMIIIPCAVVAATFYFTSSSMREQIFAQNLQGLYEQEKIIQESKQALILMKRGAADSDAPHIVRFAENEFAKKRWNGIPNFIRSEMENSKTTMIPLRVDLPVIQRLNMKVRGLRIPGGKDRKEKLLVFDILEEDSAFGFESVVIVRDEQEGAFNKNEPVVPASTFGTSNTLVNKTSSSNLASVDIEDKSRERNVNVRNMSVFHKHRAKDSQGNFRHREDTGIEVDISTASPESTGDAGTRHGDFKRTEESKDDNSDVSKEAFTLGDFDDMIAQLEAKENVSNFLSYGPFEMPPAYGEAKYYSLRAAYDKEGKKRRQYKYATFSFNKYSVCIIEIDQNGLPQGCATYALRADASYSYAQDDIDTVTVRFVRYEKVGDIATALKGRGITLLSKRHPAEKDNKYYERWAEELLEMIRSK